jgi:hypothetical protein
VAVEKFQKEDYKSFEPTFTEKEKAFLTKFFEFSKSILMTMYSVLDTESKSAMENMWNNPNTSPKLSEMMALYILTGGNTDMAKMNLSQKTAITLAPIKFATERNDAKALANLAPYYARITTDGESLIPTEVREVLKLSFQEVE